MFLRKQFFFHPEKIMAPAGNFGSEFLICLLARGQGHLVCSLDSDLTVESGPTSNDSKMSFPGVNGLSKWVQQLPSEHAPQFLL